ncbi:MAG: hypothetical protein HY754_03065 [Nitrospirae bacterium]|nr:hypothetical protein [Nitrospirota bacterium]
MLQPSRIFNIKQYNNGDICLLSVESFPAKRTLNVLLGAGIIFFLILYFTMRSIIPHDLNTPEGLINSIMTFKTAAPLLPSYWVSETVFPILKGSGMKTFYMVVLLSNSAFFLLLSSTISLRLYRENIERIQPSGENKRRGFFRDFYPPNNAAIFYKDIKIFFRDTGQWSQVFIIGALIMVYIYNFRAIPINMISELTPFVREFMVMVNMLLAGLVLSAVAARFIYSSVSLEGEAFWIIKTSPVDMNRFLWAKFLYGCIPVTSLIVFLVFLTNLAINVKGLLMFISVGTTFMLCISISGLGTGFGAIYPKFRYENIASVSMSLGGMAFMLIAFGTAIITLSLEPWIFYIYNIRVEGGLNFIEKIQIAACLVSIVMVNAVVFYLPMRIGRMRLDKNKEITF